MQTNNNIENKLSEDNGNVTQQPTTVNETMQSSSAL